MKKEERKKVDANLKYGLKGLKISLGVTVLLLIVFFVFSYFNIGNETLTSKILSIPKEKTDLFMIFAGFILFVTVPFVLGILIGNSKSKNKKAQSSVILVIIIIILILLLLIILWNVLKVVLSKNVEITQISTRLVTQRTDIQSVEGDLVNPSVVNITLHGGSAKLVLNSSNYIDVSESEPVDVYSVVDLSGSMGNGQCFLNYSSDCCNLYNCSNSSGCKRCTRGRSTFNASNGECKLYSDCNSIRDCFNNTNTIDLNSYYYNCFNLSETSYNPHKVNYFKSKIDFAREANEKFISSILNLEENRVGIIGYAGYAAAINNALNTSFHYLSNDFSSVNNILQKLQYIPYGDTCICCGVNRSVEYFELNDKQRIDVVMTDGGATKNCNLGGDASQDAITSACNAYNNKGVKVYTIGFLIGNEADKQTLRDMAECGNGTYYDSSNIGDLTDIYTEISTQIQNTYTKKSSYYMKIVFYSSDGSSYVYNLYDIPVDLETRTYPIDLTEKISDVVKVETYYVASTSWGEEVIGKATDVWTSDDN
ncbi:MAG: vWA domain-containing protein [Candidatus Pacearchaeota archaeon]